MPGHFGRKPAIIFKAGRDIGHIVFGFNNRLAGVAAFEFGEFRSFPAEFFRQLEQNAPAILRRGLRPWARIKRNARRFYRAIDIGRISRSNLRDNFFRGRIVDWKSFAGRRAFPFAIHKILIAAYSRCCTA